MYPGIGLNGFAIYPKTNTVLMKPQYGALLALLKSSSFDAQRLSNKNSRQSVPCYFKRTYSKL